MAENKDSNTTYNVDTKDSTNVFVGDNITVNNITVHIYPPKDGEPQSTAEPPDRSKTILEFDDPRECIIVSKEMAINAGREENKVYDKGSVLESQPSGSETTVKTAADKTESRKPTQESQKPRRLDEFLRRLRSKIRQSLCHGCGTDP